jgi:hypothetical protein
VCSRESGTDRINTEPREKRPLISNHPMAEQAEIIIGSKQKINKR